MAVPTRPELLASHERPSVPRQTRSRTKRARLIEAALALFAQHGYDATSIETIARQAQLAVGTFYQHFRSKRHLLLYLMDDLLDHLNQIDFQLKPSSDPWTALRIMFASALAGNRDAVGAYRAWQEAALTDPELARTHGEIQRWMSARILRAVELLQKLSYARSDVDVAALGAVVEAVFWRLLTLAMGASDAERERGIHAATYVTYHALFADRPSRTTRWTRSSRRRGVVRSSQ